jgi:tetratricopeptide (TPR) repeat protein
MGQWRPARSSRKALSGCRKVVQTVSALSQVLAHTKTNAGEHRYGVNDSLAVTTLSYIARALSDAGRDNEAWTAANEAMAVAERLRNPFASTFAYTGLGYCHLRLGDPLQAVDWLRRAYEAATIGDAPLVVPAAGAFLAWSLVDAGRGGEGLEFAARAVSQADAIGFRVLQPMRLFILAHALAACGRLYEARHRAQAAIAMANAQKELGAKAHALGVLGRVQLAEDKAAGIETLRSARALAEQLALRPVQKEIEIHLLRLEPIEHLREAIP